MLTWFDCDRDEWWWRSWGLWRFDCDHDWWMKDHHTRFLWYILLVWFIRMMIHSVVFIIIAFAIRLLRAQQHELHILSGTRYLFFYYCVCHPTINVQHELQRWSPLHNKHSPKEQNDFEGKSKLKGNLNICTMHTLTPFCSYFRLYKLLVIMRTVMTQSVTAHRHSLSPLDKTATFCHKLPWLAPNY